MSVPLPNAFPPKKSDSPATIRVPQTEPLWCPIRAPTPAGSFELLLSYPSSKLESLDLNLCSVRVAPNYTQNIARSLRNSRRTRLGGPTRSGPTRWQPSASTLISTAFSGMFPLLVNFLRSPRRSERSLPLPSGVKARYTKVQW